MTQLAADAEEKEIDGQTYQVRKLDFLTANDLFLDLTKTLGPALGALAGTMAAKMSGGDVISQLLDGEGLEGQGGGEAIERGIRGVIDRLDKAQLRELIKTMAGVTKFKTPKAWVPFDSDGGGHMQMAFNGKLFSMYAWLAFALRVQYADFFSGNLTDIASAVQETVQG